MRLRLLRDDTVGQILSTLGTREIQLALKLIF
jgi:hypothetical protein